MTGQLPDDVPEMSDNEEDNMGGMMHEQDSLSGSMMSSSNVSVPIGGESQKSLQ